ncbi:GGDEF domain-containing protein [Pseudomaricurvus alkylphenolicus]|uniref:GGDEF domain-containing protein n=1 Tax=Pseudomaricurvus alkylphenolicus TaxID=1306991 RepID=UPI00142142CE|nr:GGDEF domain-containing protein [Pseudomaricurvus alkylphenolicus]NIB42912.1 GGDEF domain-containing protein [Pseudomaricurvus alkylphenolicus]
MNSTQDDALMQLAMQRLESALEKMREHAIPATPENIMVWYHYVVEDIPQLNSEVDRVINRELAFTPQICHQLYHRFFTEVDRRKMDLLRDAIRQLIAHFLDHIHVLSDGITDYEQVLNDCAESLRGEQDEASLVQLVDRLLQHSQKAKNVSCKARQKIETLNEEVNQLRNTLQELERSALEDALTGIANRRAFDQIFEEQVKLTKTTGRGCCLLLLDIDHFKVFNDKYGHQSGDKVLRFVASILKKMIKGQDFVARFGGEEFAVLLPATEYGGGMALAQSIANRIGGTKLTIGSNQEPVDPITVSIGVSWCRKKDTADTLFSRADASLYQAKESGRNKVVGQQDLKASAV